MSLQIPSTYQQIRIHLEVWKWKSINVNKEWDIMANKLNSKIKEIIWAFQFCSGPRYNCCWYGLLLSKPETYSHTGHHLSWVGNRTLKALPSSTKLTRTMEGDSCSGKYTKTGNFIECFFLREKGSQASLSFTAQVQQTTTGYKCGSWPGSSAPEHEDKAQSFLGTRQGSDAWLTLWPSCLPVVPQLNSPQHVFLHTTLPLLFSNLPGKR